MRAVETSRRRPAVAVSTGHVLAPHPIGRRPASFDREAAAHRFRQLVVSAEQPAAPRCRAVATAHVLLPDPASPPFVCRAPGGSTPQPPAGRRSGCACGSHVPALWSPGPPHGGEDVDHGGHRPRWHEQYTAQVQQVIIGCKRGFCWTARCMPRRGLHSAHRAAHPNYGPEQTAARLRCHMGLVSRD